MIIKTGLILLGLVCATSLFSQDTSWHRVKVNDDLIFNLPGEVARIDTIIKKGNKAAQFRFFKAESKYSVLGLSITPNETNIDIEDNESFKIALKEMAEGMCKSATESGFICTTNDTIIDRIACKKVMFFQHGVNYPEMVNYVFLVNDRIYSFTQASTSDDGEGLADELNKLLASVDFNHVDIKEQKFGSKAEAVGYNVGYVFGQILGFLLIGVIVLFVFKKIFSKSKKYE